MSPEATAISSLYAGRHQLRHVVDEVHQRYATIVLSFLYAVSFTPTGANIRSTSIRCSLVTLFSTVTFDARAR